MLWLLISRVLIIVSPFSITIFNKKITDLYKYIKCILWFLYKSIDELPHYISNTIILVTVKANRTTPKWKCNTFSTFQSSGPAGHNKNIVIAWVLQNLLRVHEHFLITFNKILQKLCRWIQRLTYPCHSR